MPGNARQSLRAADRNPMLALVDSCVSPDQIPQLRQYREEHPEVEIAMRAGMWQATIQEPDGVRTIVRWHLRDLLSRLFEQNKPGHRLRDRRHATDGAAVAPAARRRPRWRRPWSR
jgi:hypothetical protein